MSVDHIFIVHYTPLTDRKAYLIKRFTELGISNYTFYEEYNRNTTSKETMKHYFKLNNLTPAQICITIAHLEIYRIIAQRKYTRCLILEDDAILCPDFDVKLASYMKELPEDFHLAFLSSGCGLVSQNVSANKVWYRASSSRTCSGYVIGFPTCERLLETAIPFVKAIDHELNIQINKHNLNTYWAEPALIKHGSETVYKSSYIYY
jgi:GR25 family glycosyltransferase involved in LPS biosynthesis